MENLNELYICAYKCHLYTCTHDGLYIERLHFTEIIQKLFAPSSHQRISWRTGRKYHRLMERPKRENVLVNYQAIVNITGAVWWRGFDRFCHRWVSSCICQLHLTNKLFTYTQLSTQQNWPIHTSHHISSYNSHLHY